MTIERVCSHCNKNFSGYMSEEELCKKCDMYIHKNCAEHQCDPIVLQVKSAFALIGLKNEKRTNSNIT